MSEPASINPRIIEGLYAEALILSDEVRAAFDMSAPLQRHGAEYDNARLALSCEALRTTTRMMHALAWLLNHRAYFAGELSEFQLRRYGRLTPDVPSSDPERMTLLDFEVRKLIAATERFYARLVRLDHEWRDRRAHTPVAALHERIGTALAG